MMHDSDIALHEQRRFLMVAFHPYGSDVCSCSACRRRRSMSTRSSAERR